MKKTLRFLLVLVAVLLWLLECVALFASRALEWLSRLSLRFRRSYLARQYTELEE